VKQFVGRSRGDAESIGAAAPVGDHEGLDAIAATRAATYFKYLSLGRRSRFLLPQRLFVNRHGAALKKDHARRDAGLMRDRAAALPPRRVPNG
jgi:hypothetical protein